MPETSAKLKTREELEKDWWDRWWAKDYSWEGLAKKPTVAWGSQNGIANLQDYWRRQYDERGHHILRENDELIQLGELIADNKTGKLWHILHFEKGAQRGDFHQSVLTASQMTICRKIVADRLRQAMPSGEKTEKQRASIQVMAQMAGVILPLEWGLPSEIPYEICANFEDAYFPQWHLGDRNFKPCSFRGSMFAGLSMFNNSIFTDQPDFVDAFFLGPANFDRARFRDNAYFKRCVFLELCRFQRALFEKDAHFADAKFLGKTRFGEATFQGQAFFEQIAWPLPARDWHNAFDRVEFQGRASFFGSGCRSFAAFDRTIFRRGIQIDNVSEDEAAAQFEFELRGTECAADADAGDPQDIERWRSIEGRHDEAELSQVEVPRFRAFRRRQRQLQLERGCRTLKQEMANDSDRIREHLFYRFELMARRAQSTTSHTERFASYAYGAMSDYGSSIGKPILGLAICILLFGAIYAWISEVNPPKDVSRWGNIGYAMDLSVSRIIQPWSYLSASSMIGNPLAESLLDPKNGAPILTRAVVSIQSVFTYVLFFLAGLAIRRRFQIN